MRKLLERYSKCTVKVKNSVNAMVPLEILRSSQLNVGHLISELFARKIRFRVIIDKASIEQSSAWIKAVTKNGALNLDIAKLVDLRFIDTIPFHLVIFDSSEVIWGDFHVKEDGSCLWTNLPLHVQIVKTAFDATWQKTWGLEEIQVRD